MNLFDISHLTLGDWYVILSIATMMMVLRDWSNLKKSTNFSAINIIIVAIAVGFLWPITLYNQLRKG